MKFMCNIKPHKITVSVIVSTLFILLFPISCVQKVTITERKELFRTYPFSDPNPITQMGVIYPYFRFDGYTATPVDREWKIVTLENSYIKVFVAPEIGGKVLGAIDKSSNRPFIYYNRVIKFRDIALRGPWTSGGIEFNFGVLGHTPATATPVDYLLKNNPDGSVSCFVGGLDLPSRTEWRVEIRLPKDKAYFETRSLWYNPTELSTSLYHWMNSAADAAEELQFYYPGQYYVDHSGTVYSFPKNKEGTDISLYANNNFGSYKSYHVLGEYTNYFGGYYENADFGTIHWAPYEEKPGKKIWIWGLSRQGLIWEDLLTDKDLGNTQYVEIQSGLLFNQADSRSGKTPFKHTFFSPNSVERFEELWFPVKGIGGIADANAFGALNVTQIGSKVKFGVYAAQNLNEPLIITDGNQPFYSARICLKPTEVFLDSVELNIPDTTLTVIVGKNLLTYNKKYKEKQILDRPVIGNEEFDWNSAEGLYSDGVDRAQQRDYAGALEKYTACLVKNPVYTLALIGAAEIYYRRMEYAQALELVIRALANDTYDPDANFIYGIVNRKLNKNANAKDGFGFAARSMKYRSAAYTQLAELYFTEQNYTMAEFYAKKAIDYNRYNIPALKILALNYRKQHNTRKANEILDTVLEIDPLNHFANFERYCINPKQKNETAFITFIRNELPYESYLELAIYYANLELPDDAILLLKKAPEHPLVHYWLAYLYDKQNRSEESTYHLNSALSASPYLVFPFRQETVAVLNWAQEKNAHWKTAYYLALIYWSKNRYNEADRYFADCSDAPDFAPFYVTRGNFYRQRNVSQSLKDYEHALTIDNNQWRIYHVLAQYYTEYPHYDKALYYALTGAKKFPNNYILNFDYAQALLYTDDYEKCLSILDTITILPYEGARYGHEIYRTANILLTLNYIKKGMIEKALQTIENAKLWPENLGAGKPYDVDIRIENYLDAYCKKKRGQNEEAQMLLREIVQYTENHPESYDSHLLVSALALVELEFPGRAYSLIEQWLQKSPLNSAAQWCRAYIHNNTAQAQTIFRQMLYKSPGTWSVTPDDSYFKVILAITETIRGTM